MRKDILNWKHYQGEGITAPFFKLFESGPVTDVEFRFLINNSSENVAEHEHSHYDPLRICLNSIYYKDKFIEQDLSEVDNNFINGKKVNYKGFLERIKKYPMSQETFDRLIRSTNTTGDFDRSKQNRIYNSNNIRLLANKLHSQLEYRQQHTPTENLYLAEKIYFDLEKQVENSQKQTSAERKHRLEKASKIPEKIQIISVGYKRNSDVIAETLLRANGICEKCSQNAPFLRRKDNSPYLEVHHKVMLSNGGEDILENAIALCPNCHREQHFGLWSC